MINLELAHKFVSAFGPGPNTYQTFFDDKKYPDPSVVAVIQDGKGCQERLIGKSKNGVGVFLTINRTDGTGRKEENVVALRALFIDIDGKPKPKSWHMEPNMVVTRDGAEGAWGWALDSGCNSKSLGIWCIGAATVEVVPHLHFIARPAVPSGIIPWRPQVGHRNGIAMGAPQ